jgi:hypothetical protein
VIERVVESLPQRYFITSLYLVEEPIDSSDSLALMVTSEHYDLLGEAALEGIQEANDFTGLFSSVYVVAHEEIACLKTDDFIRIRVRFVFLLHFLEHM